MQRDQAKVLKFAYKAPKSGNRLLAAAHGVTLVAASIAPNATQLGEVPYPQPERAAVWPKTTRRSPRLATARRPIIKNGVASPAKRKNLQKSIQFLTVMVDGARRKGLQALTESETGAATMVDILSQVLKHFDSPQTATHLLVNREDGKKLRNVLDESSALNYAEFYGQPKKLYDADSAKGTFQGKINSIVNEMETALRGIVEDKDSLKLHESSTAKTILTDKAFDKVREEFVSSIARVMKNYKPATESKKSNNQFLQLLDMSTSRPDEEVKFKRGVSELRRAWRQGTLTRKQSLRLIDLHNKRISELVGRVNRITAANAIAKSRLAALDVENKHTANRLSEKDIWSPVADFIYSLAGAHVRDGIESRVPEFQRDMMSSWIPDKTIDASNEFYKFLVGYSAYLKEPKQMAKKSAEYYFARPKEEVALFVMNDCGGDYEKATSDEGVHVVEVVGNKVSMVKSKVSMQNDHMWQKAKLVLASKLNEFAEDVQNNA